MILKFRKLSVSTTFGALAIILYIGLAKISYFYYPSSFGPKGNWLSDLGNTNLNPAGAIYYRLAGILGGLALIFFFIYLRDWYKNRQDKFKIFISIAQIFGILASIAFILTGYFSEDNIIFHSFFSKANFILFGTAVFFVGFAFLYQKGFSKLFSVFCFFIVIADIISGFFGNTRWLEWLVVSMLLIFLALLSYATNIKYNSSITN